ncbi:MAG TPA: ATP/GTP-binding protein [Streptosporangiaceae bacterium]|nr:ATP/GTP-binding protein [Streptosporangiaceae bacterium]
MSPRRIRRPPAAPDWPAGPERAESWPDGDWIVRQMPGAAASKAYRCPGCDQEIWPGTAHVVAWPAQTPGADARRHWHRACWQRRLHRRPGRGRRG